MASRDTMSAIELYRPCLVSERLAKQKFSHWGFPVNSNEAEIFLLSCLANCSLSGQHHHDGIVGTIIYKQCD